MWMYIAWFAYAEFRGGRLAEITRAGIGVVWKSRSSGTISTNSTTGTTVRRLDIRHRPGHVITRNGALFDLSRQREPLSFTKPWCLMNGCRLPWSAVRAMPKECHAKRTTILAPNFWRTKILSHLDEHAASIKDY